MKLVFFPEGKSVFGYASRMKMSQGDFKYEEITDWDFSLMNYVKLHKLSKVRLYLLTNLLMISKISLNPVTVKKKNYALLFMSMDIPAV